MNTTTELATWTEAYNTNLVAIFLTEESYCTHFLCFLHWCITMLVKRIILTNHLVDKFLYLTKFLIGYLLEVRNIEAERVRTYVRTFLLGMLTKNLLQSIIKQVGCSMISCRRITLIGINTCHEFCLNILWQFLDNMDALVVLTLGINDIDRLILVDKHTLIAYLSTHLTIEWGIIEYNLIETILLLCHLTITENMTFVLCIIVTNELLFAFTYNLPVTILNNSSIASTCFLLFHLFIELLLINGITILTTDKFGQVEWETICIKQAEGFLTIKFGLAMCLQFIHCTIEQCDTLIQCAQERIFLFLHHTTNQFTLCCKFRISNAHLMYQNID